MVKEFENWLKKNRDKLPDELRTLRKTRRGREYQFRNVPHIELLVSRNGTFSIAVMYRRVCVDLLVDFEIVLKKTPAGTYYCDWCKSEGHAMYTKVRMRLFDEHSFKSFLKWCKMYIREDRYLVMMNREGMSAARICTRDELKTIVRKPRYRLFVVKPVIRSSRRRKNCEI